MLEMFIVISILGIMAAIAIPNFLSYLPKYRLNGATRVVASDLMFTRMEAVKLNRSAYMEFTGAKQYEISYLGKVLRMRDISEDYPDVDIEDFDKIVFTSRGSSDANKTVTIKSDNGQTKVVGVGIAGRVKIQ